MLRRRLIVILTAALLLASLAGAAAAREPAPDRSWPPSAATFEALSQDLQRMEGLFQRSDGQRITFDAGTARRQGFSAASIALARELAAFANELLAASVQAEQGGEAAGWAGLHASLRRYPRLAAYFEAAVEQGRQVGSGARQAQIEWQSQDPARYICGVWWHPVPLDDNPWYTLPDSYPSQDEAVQQLAAWGYHATPDWAGGGFTRPETYYPQYCGQDTFRDHSSVFEADSSWWIREQNYTGEIPGEPSPEIFSSGPWPYLLWPVYVWWWHEIWTEPRGE